MNTHASAKPMDTPATNREQNTERSMEAVLPAITEQEISSSSRLSQHLAYFGLTEEPFQLTPNRRFFFKSSCHNATLEVVRYGIRQGEGFIIVTGEVGTGKTLLLRMLLSEFRNSYETALILSPLLSPAELIQAILVDVDQEIPENNNLDSLLRKLNDYLFTLAGRNKKLAVIIDEAQNLPVETIEQLRLLSNFESDQQKWMQIILVGQPELRTRLREPGLRQLLQRVTIMETLLPLTKKEAGEYVHFRMSQAGRDDIHLKPGARRTLWRLTQGVPRRINRLMGRSLLIAYSRHSQRISSSILKQANASLAVDHDDTAVPFWRVRPVLLVAGCLFLGLVSLALYLHPGLMDSVHTSVLRLLAMEP